MTANRAARPDLLVGLFVVLLGGLALWQAAAIPESLMVSAAGPKLVPYLVGGALLLLGAALAGQALRGGWSHALEEAGGPVNFRALALLGAGLLANLVLIGPLGFCLAATVQFVLVAAAFGSRHPLRDLGIALVLTLLAWFGFVEVLGVDIGAGLLEQAILRALGQEVP